MQKKLKNAGYTRIYNVGKKSKSFLTVLPKEIREAFDIQKGDTLLWSINTDTASIEIRVFPNVDLPEKGDKVRVLSYKIPYQKRVNETTITSKQAIDLFNKMLANRPALRKKLGTDITKLLNEE